MIQYMTFCKHHILASLPVDCQHGSLTGTASSPPRGVLYTGYAIYVADGGTDR